MAELRDQVEELKTRVQRLENLVWVVGALAIALGAGGASLWNSLSNGRERANELETRLTKLQREVDGIDKIVAASVADVRKAEEANLKRVGEEVRERLSALPGNNEKRFSAIESHLFALNASCIHHGNVVFLRTWRNMFLTAPDGGAVQSGIVRSNSPNQGQDEALVVVKRQ